MKKISMYCIRVFFLWGICAGFSQNLVTNPSFEDHSACPVKLGNFSTDVIGWSTRTKGSTDYFHSCSEAMGTPKNFNGTQIADFGEGYAGFYLFAPNDYREYMQAKLLSPLRKGVFYELSFFVDLANVQILRSMNLGWSFLSNPSILRYIRNCQKCIFTRILIIHSHIWRLAILILRMIPRIGCWSQPLRRKGQ